jgi:uncharacterized protein YdhG (YjbR/CyaY superfamily)
MAKTIESVDAYIATLPDAVRPVLRRVRSAIRKALPRAEESISYGIPTYKVGGRAVLYFAGWKQHYSLYPMSRRLVEALGQDLEPYELSKGTLRLPLSRPAPTALIARIAKYRAKETAERTKPGRGAPKKRRETIRT